MKIYDVKVTKIPNIAFSWKLEGNANQVSYRICIFDEQKATVWDSSEVASGDRHNIVLPVEIDNHMTYTWQLTVKDANGEIGAAKGPAFSKGLTTWQASWVEPDRVRKPLTDTTKPIHGMVEQKNPFEVLDAAVDMRKTFVLETLPEKALMFSTARGIYTLSVNGTRISDLFAPGFTSYHSRIDYQQADVTALLKEGENVIAATLADGWFTGKIAQWVSDSSLARRMHCCFRWMYAAAVHGQQKYAVTAI